MRNCATASPIHALDACWSIDTMPVSTSNMTEQIDTHATLAATASWTAGVRARETQREDRLFEDPWAEALAGETGAAWITQRPPESTLPIVLRTRFFDDFLLRITHEQNIRQIVLVGAGFDTRAFRLSLPEGTTLFEIDQAEVLQQKQIILDRAGAKPACARRVICADLAAHWKEDLFRAGFVPSQPAGWLIEGLMFYLSNDAGLSLLDAVTALSVKGSRLGFDVVNSATLTSPYTIKWVQMQAGMGAPWIGTMDQPEEVLAARGWQATLTQAGQPDANHGRWSLPVLPVTMPNFPHNWLVTAQKIE